MYCIYSEFKFQAHQITFLTKNRLCVTYVDE